MWPTRVASAAHEEEGVAMPDKAGVADHGAVDDEEAGPFAAVAVGLGGDEARKRG
jgi:hypothetical protein